MTVLGRLPDTVIGDALPTRRPAEHVMSMPAVRKTRWTIEEVERLIDEREGYTPRYELVDGELLVTAAPSNRHQRIVRHLFLLLHPYVTRHRLGETCMGPGEVRLEPSAYFEPDVYVVPSENGRRPRLDVIASRLLLAAEVLSPSSVRHDRITKRRFFQKYGVPDYWVVDSDAEAFEVWRPGDDRSTLIDEALTWHPAGAPEPLVFSVRDFFAGVADED